MSCIRGFQDSLATNELAMYLKFAKTRNTKSPMRANYGDAGIDFFVPDDFETVSLGAHERANIPSGIKVEVPQGWALVFFNKSGVASKRGLIIGACVVDHGYKGEVHLNVINASNDWNTISPGTKLAQALMLQVGTFVPMCVEEDDLYAAHPAVGDRGAGGFGSSGA